MSDKIWLAPNLFQLWALSLECIGVYRGKNVQKVIFVDEQLLNIKISYTL
jgi:hypothetical protein